MLTKRTINIVLLVVICFVGFTFLIFPKTTLNNFNIDDVLDERTCLDWIKSANNDTSPPIITFIQPDTDNITIKSKIYYIIVKIEDENPPLPGNVSLEILKANSSLFNGSMTLITENEWIFTWDNITSYPNRQIYSLKVTAKDNSTIGNIGISEVKNLYVDLSKSPGALNILIYVIAASVLIAGISIWVNKKRIHHSANNDVKRINYLKLLFSHSKIHQ
ncbi:MAG: hypothetical protein ACFFFT_15040 [Candidatus Thorarchaeota archaeon]